MFVKINNCLLSMLQVPMDQVELEIYRVHGLTDKTENRGSFWIKYDLGYSKDEKIGEKTVCVRARSLFASTMLP